MDSSSKTGRNVGVALFVGVVLASLGWAAYTGHIWEDFYITYRASKNLALGNGLVFTPGERLHTFTSPVQALVPALIAWVTACRSDEWVIWTYRVLGACALGGCAVFLWRIFGRDRFPLVAAMACIGLFAFDAKTLDFTASGMETPFLLFFMAWQAYLVFTEGSIWLLGAAWAGMMWSRPDAAVQIAAFYGALLVFAPKGHSIRALVLRAVRAGAVAAVLYLPWLIWATWYYGSPIPHTVLAKGLDSPVGFGAVLRAIEEAPMKVVTFGVFQRVIFAPTYVGVGPMEDWGLTMHSVWRLLGLPVWCYWINPWGSPWARTVSLWLFLGSIYYVCAPTAYWYLPPYALVAMMGWGFIVSDLTDRLGVDGDLARRPSAGTLRLIVPCLVLGAVAFQMGVSVLMANTMRQQQTIIEEGNRRPIGLWLRKTAAPGDTVFLECLGYIGYFSNLKMYDFPGLASEEVVAARRKLHTDGYGAIIREVKPTWLVLRPVETKEVNYEAPGLLSDDGSGEYRLARVYDQSARVAALKGIYGRSFIAWDQTFYVYHRSR